MAEKKVLLLFSKSSVSLKQANPNSMVGLFNDAAKQTAKYDYSAYEDLTFILNGPDASVTDINNGWDLRGFDFVYHRRWGDNPGEAVSSGIYLKKNKIPYIDREVDRTGSANKLNQYWRFWEAGLPIPKTVYLSPEHLAKILEPGFLESSGITPPFIMKSLDGTRGQDNYLVKDLAQAKEIINDNPTIRFLIQEFIPNDGDYRVVVGGDKILLVIRRNAAKGSHKNNTSQGAKATLVSAGEFSPEVRSQIIAAAKAFGRDLAGVDIVFKQGTGEHFFFEVNRSPQIEASSFSKEKAAAIHKFFMEQIDAKKG